MRHDSIERNAVVGAATSGNRRRLLQGLETAMEEQGFQRTTIADIVGNARTSRRAFYKYFASREACLIALHVEASIEQADAISAAVDRDAPWATQVRQGVSAWIASAESRPAVTLSWVRDVPLLGEAADDLKQEEMERFIALVEGLTSSESFRLSGGLRVSRPRAIVLLGGLQELAAITVERGGTLQSVADEAVQAALALLAPPASG
ncbi:TetR/AcrR family transcriptional regulator [Mycolicibacter minnesotensis]